MFADRVIIEVQAGRGGDGCVSFRREKYIPHGGPDGGDGGTGGSVILIARSGVNNLSALNHQRFWKAISASAGSGANKHGKDGKDLIIEVPPGTIIKDAKKDLVIKDLTFEGDQVVVAQGGRGGKGNVAFKSSVNRAPREFSRGGDGERVELILELKVIADVGLVGKPNAGKSTLLSRLTRARPQIADYPFTTKHPNLGIVNMEGERQFVMADIPGLIEGAHSGAGLGHEFLRHIERAGILIHLIEPAPMDGTEPLQNYRAIRSELEQHDASLGLRPEILVVSKAELPTAADVQAQLAQETGRDVLLISAVTGVGLNTLTQRIWEALEAGKTS